MTYVHVVLFQLHEGVDVEHVHKILNASQPEWALEWTIATSLDARKGPVVIERAVFRDTTDFEAFQASEPHRAAGRLMARCSDWLIGDYIAQVPG